MYKAHSSLPFFSEADVGEVLEPADLIAAMRTALADFSSGRVQQPVRTVVSLPEQEAFFGLMPVVYGGILGAKFVTVFPGNFARSIPTHQALIVTFRADTGEPLAVLDGRLITELRTAAVSAVATDLLAAPQARRLAILGSGVQARAHVRILSLVRQFSEIRVWSRNPEHARRCARDIGGIATSAEAAVRGADVVVTVTNSPTPVLHGTWLEPGSLAIAAGAVGRDRRELDSDSMSGAVIVDSREAALQESGDVLLAGATIHAELGELLSGTAPLPRSARHTVFKSLGIAVEDIAAAQLVLRVKGLLPDTSPATQTSG